MSQGYEVYIENTALHDFMTITGVERTILPPRKNYSQEIPSMYGEYYQGFNYGVREVKLTGFIEANNQEERNEGLYYLADILNVSTPQRFVSSDDPDKYYFAVPDSISQDRIRDNEEIEITLKCYDVYKYALKDDFFKPSSNGVTTVVNGGSVETFPITSVQFSGKACFFQCTNPYGETILIGNRPSIDKANSEGNVPILSDPCNSLNGWNKVTDGIESGLASVGSAKVNGGGFGIVCGNYGTGSGWHGVAIKKQLPKGVKNFKAYFDLVYNAKGDTNNTGVGIDPPTTTTATYTIKQSPSVRIKSEANSIASTIGQIPYGEVVEVSEINNSWGKVSYNGITGYIPLDCASLYQEVTSEVWSIKALEDTYIRSGAGFNFNVLSEVAKGTTTTTDVTQEVNGWYKVKVRGVTGYTPSKSWEKYSTTRNLRNISRASNVDVSQLGRLEVYGLGASGERLFRVVLKDVDKFYEATQPEGYIGSDLVLQDSNTSNSYSNPINKNPNGTSITPTVDGRLGKWNEFTGRFTVTRDEDSWRISLEKTQDGRVVSSISTNTLKSGGYPKGNLSSIVVYYGQYGTDTPTKVMTVTGVNIDEVPTVDYTKNNPIFKQGDELIIDHVQNMCYLNGYPFMRYLDIGSHFFSVPTGESQFIYSTDDTNADINVGITKRYL